MVQAPDGDAPNTKQRAALAARLRSAIEGSFVHWEAVPDLDFDGAFEAYLDEAFAASSRLAFVLANQRLMAQLRNGHTGFSDDWVTRRHGRSFGLMLRPLADGQWTVTSSRHDDIPLGSVVERVNVASMNELFARCRPFLAASNDRAAANGLFFRRHLLPDSITLGLQDGREVSITKGDWVPPERSLPEIRKIEGMAVLHISGFDDPRMEAAAVEAVSALDRSEPLIIDLRGNGGGSTPLVLLSALMDRPYQRWRSIALRTSTLERAIGKEPEPLTFDAPRHEPAQDAHRGRIAILIDGMVGSAAEDFVMPFKDNGRAVLIGETTAGSSGQPHFVGLSDGFRAWIGAKREVFPDGSTFEGVGISPDLPVERTAAELREGRDQAMTTALDWIAT